MPYSVKLNINWNDNGLLDGIPSEYAKLMQKACPNPLDLLLQSHDQLNLFMQLNGYTILDATDEDAIDDECFVFPLSIYEHLRYQVAKVVYPLHSNSQQLNTHHHSSGCKRLSCLDDGMDEFLGGGIPVGQLTEICGASSTGKTQLCLQLAISAMLSQLNDKETGRPSVMMNKEAAISEYKPTDDSYTEWETSKSTKKVLYIYSGQPCSTTRLSQMIQEHCKSSQTEGLMQCPESLDFLSRFLMMKIEGIDELFAFVKADSNDPIGLTAMIQKEGIALVILDAIALGTMNSSYDSFHGQQSKATIMSYSESNDKQSKVDIMSYSNSNDKHLKPCPTVSFSSKLFALSNGLKHLARTFDIPIVCTNHLSHRHQSILNPIIPYTNHRWNDDSIGLSSSVIGHKPQQFPAWMSLYAPELQQGMQPAYGNSWSYCLNNRLLLSRRNALGSMASTIRMDSSCSGTSSNGSQRFMIRLFGFGEASRTVLSGHEDVIAISLVPSGMVSGRTMTEIRLSE